jgi:hypothetical protein
MQFLLKTLLPVSISCKEGLTLYQCEGEKKKNVYLIRFLGDFWYQTPLIRAWHSLLDIRR